MKRILLLLVCLVSYQAYGADHNADFDAAVVVWIADRPQAVKLDAKKTDTVKTITDRFYNLRNSCNRIDLVQHGCLFTASENPRVLMLTINSPSIEITCHTLTGKAFKVEWELFSTCTTLNLKIVEDKLLEIGPGYQLKFIHKRAGKLDDRICADQVEGLLEDPNLTVIMELIRR